MPRFTLKDKLTYDIVPALMSNLLLSKSSARTVAEGLTIKQTLLLKKYLPDFKKFMLDNIDQYSKKKEITNEVELSNYQIALDLADEFPKTDFKSIDDFDIFLSLVKENFLNFETCYSSAYSSYRNLGINYAALFNILSLLDREQRDLFEHDFVQYKQIFGNDQGTEIYQKLSSRLEHQSKYDYMDFQKIIFQNWDELTHDNMLIKSFMLLTAEEKKALKLLKSELGISVSEGFDIIQLFSSNYLEDFRFFILDKKHYLIQLILHSPNNIQEKLFEPENVRYPIELQKRLFSENFIAYLQGVNTLLQTQLLLTRASRESHLLSFFESDASLETIQKNIFDLKMQALRFIQGPIGNNPEILQVMLQNWEMKNYPEKAHKPLLSAWLSSEFTDTLAKLPAVHAFDSERSLADNILKQNDNELLNAFDKLVSGGQLDNLNLQSLPKPFAASDYLPMAAALFLACAIMPKFYRMTMSFFNVNKGLYDEIKALKKPQELMKFLQTKEITALEQYIEKLENPVEKAFLKSELTNYNNFIGMFDKLSLNKMSEIFDPVTIERTKVDDTSTIIDNDEEKLIPVQNEKSVKTYSYHYLLGLIKTKSDRGKYVYDPDTNELLARDKSTQLEIYRDYPQDIVKFVSSVREILSKQKQNDIIPLPPASPLSPSFKR